MLAVLRRPTVWLAAAALVASGFVVYELSGAPETSAANVMTAEAEADAYTVTGRPESSAGDGAELLAGAGEGGVSVSYLRFPLPPAAPESATLRLPIAAVGADSLVEVAQTPATWDEAELSAAAAPPTGRVLDTRRVTPDDEAVVFDVSEAMIVGSGMSFAVTTPEVDSELRFRSRSSVVDVPTMQVRTVSDSASAPPAERGAAESEGACRLGPKLVPACGALLGVAPGAHSPEDPIDALQRFEETTGRAQHVYHSYHRATKKVFPSEEEIAVAEDPERPRLLFVNWKPRVASWAEIAAGDSEIDDYLDRVAEHLKENFDRPFFFTVHHEPEDNVRPEPDSGYTASDYAAMYRHVVTRLRSKGADIVPVMVYMAYLKWTEEEWHDDLYPGDDVVDWVAWDTYGYSDPGYGHGDFAELVNRTHPGEYDWPGFYHWAAERFPDKPLMIGEWGVWRSKDNPGHQAKVFRQAAEQMAHFPRLKAVLYFESPNAEGRDSRVDGDPETLEAYRRFTDSKYFTIELPRP